jgi:hypothetical protein
MANIVNQAPMQAPVSPFDPNADLDVKRKRKLAEMLMKQGEQPQATEMVGGVAVRQSPVAALARALSQGLGGMAEGQVNKQEAKIKQDQMARMAEAIKSGKFDSLAQGSPEEQMLALKARMDQDSEARKFAHELEVAGLKERKEAADKAAAETMTFGNPNATAGMAAAISQPTQTDGVFTGVSSNTPPNLPPAFNGAIQSPAQAPAQQSLEQQAMPVQDLSQDPQIAYMKGKPVTDNLKNGNAWARDPKTGQMVQVVLPNVTAKGKFEDTLKDLQNYLDQYAEAGGAVSPEHNALSNAVDYIAATKGPDWLGGLGGQTVAKALGTKQQALRDKIDAARSKAAAQYIDAAGLTSGQTNSILEQERFLKALGETSSPFESQQEAIANMSKAYGRGEIKAKKIKDVEKKKQGVKFLGFE